MKLRPLLASKFQDDRIASRELRRLASEAANNNLFPCYYEKA